MNIKVMYHSSTGNTEKIARAIAEALNVKAEPIGEGQNTFSSPLDILFIGDGVYFGKPNKRTVSFIDKLNPNIVKNVAVFATYGGQANIGSTITKLLQDKGINIACESFVCKGKAWGFLNRKHPRLLSDIHTGKINCVIIKDLSRLSRDYVEAGILIDRLFVQMNVRFINLQSG